MSAKQKFVGTLICFVAVYVMLAMASVALDLDMGGLLGGAALWAAISAKWDA